MTVQVYVHYIIISVILQGMLGLELLVSELNFHLEVFFSVGHDVFDEIKFVGVA